MIYYKGFNPKNIYLASLALLIIGLPLSSIFMSIAQFSLFINWLLTLDFKNKLRAIKQNNALLIILSFFVLHLVGLLYSTNFSYGVKDIIIKLPLFIIPLVIATTAPLARNEFKALLYLFCAAIVVSTLLNLTYYFGIFKAANQPEKLFCYYISHIRYALMICFAIFILFNYSFRKKELTGKWFVLAVISIVWLIGYLFLLKSLTGLIIFFICALAILVYFLLVKKTINGTKWFLIPVTALFIFVVISFYSVVNNYYNTKPFNWKNLALNSINGNNYEHYWLNNQRENGNYVGVYICWKELEKEWPKKSTKNYWATDSLEQPLRFTLIRYMASKGLKKDSAGFHALSANDIRNIENGKTNYLPQQGLKLRIEKVLFEFENYFAGGNPGGHSVTQRFEYWRTAFYIIADHFWFGVGTGDVNDAFQKAYTDSNSPLAQQWRLRSHNQYLAVFVTFGAIGLLLFLFSLVAPMLLRQKKSNFNYLLFLSIICLSFFTEDTLETQAGATFFAFFNSFLLFADKTKQKA